MGHSQAEKAKRRQRILDTAAGQIRELGLAGASIGELMKSAKLTHGGFYGHFASRDDLICHALDKALDEGGAEAVRAVNSKGRRTLKSLLNSYLSRSHRDNPRTGCAMAALAGEVARADRPSRDVMTDHLSNYFDSFAELVGGDDAEEFGISVMCTIVGAVTLARVARDRQVSDRILQADPNCHPR